MSIHDQPPSESTNIFETNLEREYSSAMGEELIGPADMMSTDPDKRRLAAEALAEIPGATKEEKLAAIEKKPKGDIVLDRGNILVSRKWDDEQGSVNESLKIREKTAEVNTEFGPVTIKNIRHAQERKNGTDGLHWGDAEFDEFPVIRPEKKDFQSIITAVQKKMGKEQAGPDEIVKTPFSFDGKEMVVEVSRGPNPKWGGKDYHVSAVWDGKNAKIFESKLPALNFEKTAPAERPLSEGRYEFFLQRVEINLDQDAPPPLGRLKFEIRLPQPKPETASVPEQS